MTYGKINIDLSIVFRICENCHERQAKEKHHLLSQTRLYKKLYGDLINHDKNIMFVCEQCHKWKGIKKLNEMEFCKMLDITPRSKTLRFSRFDLGKPCGH